MAENGSSSSQLAALLQQRPYQQLIRPEKLLGLPSIGAEQKENLGKGIKQLWQVISSRPPEDGKHKEALEKLQKLTQSIIETHRKFQAQQQAQGQQQRPQQQQQQQPQGGASRPISQGQSATSSEGAPQQSNSFPGQVNDIPEQFRRQVENMPWLIPTHNQTDPNYREELKKRYAAALYKQEFHFRGLQQADVQVQQLRSQGRDIPPALIQQRQKHQEQAAHAKAFIDQIMQQQQTLRQQQQQAARNANGPMLNQNQAQPQPLNQQNLQSNTNARPLPQNVPNDVARQQQVNRPATASHAHAPPNIAATATSVGQSNVPGTPQLSNFTTPRQPQPGSAGPFSQTTQASIPASGTQQQGPVPYSHQGAIDAAAKSYSSNVATQQPAVSGQIAGPTYNRTDMEKNNRKSWSISRDFKPTAPQPVQMSASRPTLAGPNNGPMGPMGQPAIQQQPRYNLQGPGDRVLDKKKLDELVRQVCGGGDGSSAQGLHPEVEEVRLFQRVR